MSSCPNGLELHALHRRPAGVLLIGVFHTHSLKHVGRQQMAAAQQRASAAQQLLCGILCIPVQTGAEDKQDASA